jgi:tetratricopeptide (TPR) repeat protein
MLTAYFDETGTNSDSDAVLITGLVATPETWDQFKVDWVKALGGLPYFHANEHSNLKDLFIEVAQVIAKHKPLILTGIVARAHWNIFSARWVGVKYLAPYNICFEECMQQMHRLVIGLDSGQEDISFVFGRQDEYRKHAGRIYRFYKGNRRWAGIRSTIDMRGDAKTVPGLQAADLVAFELAKTWSARNKDSDAPSRPAFHVLEAAGLPVYGRIFGIQELQAIEDTAPRAFKLLPQLMPAPGKSYQEVTLARINVVMGDPFAQGPVVYEQKRFFPGLTRGQFRDVVDSSAADSEPNDLVTLSLLSGGATRAIEDARPEDVVAPAITELEAVLADPNATVIQRTVAYFNRGLLKFSASDFSKASEDFTSVIELDGAPNDAIGQAFYMRALSSEQAGEIDAALDDYAAAASHVGASVQTVSGALYNHGGLLVRGGHYGLAINDFDTVLALGEAPALTLVKARSMRAIAQTKLGNPDAAITDFDLVLTTADLLPRDHALGLINRGHAKRLKSMFVEAASDYTAAINVPNAANEEIANALTARGINSGQSLGQLDLAIADFDAAIKLPGISTLRLIDARCNRGNAYLVKGDVAAAEKDYTAIINDSAATPFQLATALFSRSQISATRGDSAAVINDLSAAIETSALSGLSLALAHHNRACVHHHAGNILECRFDCNAVLAIPEAPVDMQETARDRLRQMEN